MRREVTGGGSGNKNRGYLDIECRGYLDIGRRGYLNMESIDVN